MAAVRTVVFETQRLIARYATAADAGMFYALWTDPQVMVNVGFPHGLRIDLEDLKGRLSRQEGSEFERMLVLELKETGEAIGECMLGVPDEDGLVEPDLKLLPAFWGKRYGVEAWKQMVAYLFEQTDCLAIGATPNVNNIGSIKMMEAAGGVRVCEAVYQFPEAMQAFTTPVHHYVYRAYRAGWEQASSEQR